MTKESSMVMGYKWDRCRVLCEELGGVLGEIVEHESTITGSFRECIEHERNGIKILGELAGREVARYTKQGGRS